MKHGFLVACLATAFHADRRIVDRVQFGDARSEQEHGCAKTREWVRCGLTTFDDTEVTVSATFAATEAPHTFHLVVENIPVGSYSFNSRDSATVEFRVPLAVTRGRTSLLVALHADSGSAPALLSLRSVQDHNE